MSPRGRREGRRGCFLAFIRSPWWSFSRFDEPLADSVPLAVLRAVRLVWLAEQAASATILRAATLVVHSITSSRVLQQNEQ
jgi:hypothetical protein